MGWGVPKFKPAATYGSDVQNYFSDRNPIANRNTFVGDVQNAAGGFSDLVSNKTAGPSWEPELLGSSSDYLNTDYIDKLRGLAGETGKGAWQRNQMNLAESQADQARQNLTQAGASNLATSQGNMAMRGGLTSGASERLGMQNMQSQLAGQQGIGQQLSDQALTIGGAADARQRALLGQLGQAELGAANFGAGIDQWNAQQKNQAHRNEVLANAIGNQNISPGQQGLVSKILNPVGDLVGGLI